MTDVRKDNNTLVASPADVLPLYAGNGLEPRRQTIGMETEISLYRRRVDGTLAGATAAECAALIPVLKNLGQAPQLEMASAVEYASPAFRVTELAAMNQKVAEDYAVFRAAIERAGLQVGTSQLPFATLDSARENLVDRERARGLVEGMRRFKHQSFLKVTLLCTSTQVSVSYADADDLYRVLCTGYALSPVIFALFANHPAFIEGGRDVRGEHPRAVWYGQFGGVGGIPATLLAAKDGDDFIRLHAQQVFDNEMLFYYDRDGEVVWPDRPLPFRDLAALGLNTQSNYDLAESFLDHDLKVCNIRDENGVPTGKRVEFRGFDGGALPALSAHNFIGTLLRDEKAAAELQGLLLTYGMTPDCEDFAANLQASRDAAAYHNGKFLDVTYGRGNLADFCRDLAEVMERAALRDPAANAHLLPLVDIARSGQTLAKITAAQTPDYAATLAALQAQTATPVNDGLKKAARRFGR